MRLAARPWRPVASGIVAKVECWLCGWMVPAVGHARRGRLAGTRPPSRSPTACRRHPPDAGSSGKIDWPDLERRLAAEWHEPSDARYRLQRFGTSTAEMAVSPARV